jgi:hypothetical protein
MPAERFRSVIRGMQAEAAEAVADLVRGWNPTGSRP